MDPVMKVLGELLMSAAGLLPVWTDIIVMALAAFVIAMLYITGVVYGDGSPG